MGFINSQLWSDSKLVVLLMENDRLAFETIYNKYWSKLYISAYNVLRDREASEDIVQEVLVNLWIKRSFLKIDSLNSFLYASVRNQVFKVIRSGKIRQDRIIEMQELIVDNDAEEHLINEDISRLLEQGISELPLKCRKIFVLSRKDHLSTKEIASYLGISSKTVENQLTIALRRLRPILGDFLLLTIVLLSNR